MPLAPQSKILLIKRTIMLFNKGLLCSRLYAGHSTLVKKMELGEVVQLEQECAGTKSVCLCVWACGVCGVGHNDPAVKPFSSENLGVMQFFSIPWLSFQCPLPTTTLPEASYLRFLESEGDQSSK